MKVDRIKRNQTIKTLRKQGLTWQAIAKELGIGLISLYKYRQREEQWAKYPKKPKQSLYAKRSSWLKEDQNIIAVDVTGHLVSVGDGKQYVSIHDKKLKEAIKSIYHLEAWIL